MAGYWCLSWYFGKRESLIDRSPIHHHHHYQHHRASKLLLVFSSLPHLPRPSHPIALAAADTLHRPAARSEQQRDTTPAN